MNETIGVSKNRQKYLNIKGICPGNSKGGEASYRSMNLSKAQRRFVLFLNFNHPLALKKC